MEVIAVDASQISAVLRNELKPAIGCTEPAAVAFAVAVARAQAPGAIEQISVTVDPNVYKNGAGVYVPGGDCTGLGIAAALGAIAGQASLGLEVLRDVSPDQLKAAQQLIAEQRVTISLHQGEQGLHICATIVADGHTAVAVISREHTNVTEVTLDGKAVPFALGAQDGGAEKPASGRDLRDIGLMKLVKTIIASSDDEWAFLIPLAEANLRVAAYGMEHPEGLGIGTHFQRLIKRGIISDDLVNDCLIHTAAAADARMNGAQLPVVATNGSGNQGLAVSLPIIVAARRLPDGPAHLAKALAIGQTSAVYLKQYIGKLSALCACAVASATGSALAIAYLLGCDMSQLEAAGNLIAANLTGMICDGAKVGCALKLASSSAASVQAALLASDGVTITADNGVVGQTLEATIRNIGRVSNPGMVETDSVLLSIVEEKCCRQSR
jgi:L-cysteine desulfidase